MAILETSMRGKKFPSSLALAIFAMAASLTTTAAAAQTENVLHSFTGNSSPQGALISDGNGNLYGTTTGGGTGSNPECAANGCGTVFELTPQKGGIWTETIVHNFGNGVDGFAPEAGLTFDNSGNLYGTTEIGGPGKCHCGVVFELMPQTGRGWKERLLHIFTGGRDGSHPLSTPVLDSAGNIYGSAGGGPYGYGVVFELERSVSGGYIEKTLHTFTGGDDHDGADPTGTMIIDSAGNLYGTTAYGGYARSAASDSGTVFEFRPKVGGYSYRIVYSFGTASFDAAVTWGGLIMDSRGNLYGASSGGGASGYGAVYELSPKTGGGWSEQVLYSFSGSGSGGEGPFRGSLVMDAAGHLYGNAYSGGAEGFGAAFELSLSGGAWTETVLHGFGTTGTDGEFPESGLILDTFGNVYGTTSLGGAQGGGTVFQITP
jgi:uncharacterized repeat protein (TIGR03803 family)